MAIKEIRLDDLNGEEAAETVRFGFDGQTYEIDLVAANAAKLEKALAQYVAKARNTTPVPKGSASDVDYGAVRDWAQAQGIEVSSRGRIANDVVEQFKKAMAGQSDQATKNEPATDQNTPNVAAAA